MDKKMKKKMPGGKHMMPDGEMMKKEEKLRNKKTKSGAHRVQR